MARTTLGTFTRALSNALDESSASHISRGRGRKSKSLKCHLKSKCVAGLYSDETIVKGKSDSESSLDSWIPNEMNSQYKAHNFCTDSDDVISKAFSQFSEWRSTINIGESDSVTESANKAHEPRRKRKFKRMAIDPPSAQDAQISKRNRNLRSSRAAKASVKSSKITKLSNSKMSCKVKKSKHELSNVATACGKRKRKEERNSESSNFDCKDLVSDSVPFSRTLSCQEFNFVDEPLALISDKSSSESEAEQSADEESREADDEQSDFFCEPGTSYGVVKSDDDDEAAAEEEAKQAIATYCHIMEIPFDVIPCLRHIYNIRRQQMYETLHKKIAENGYNVKAGQRKLWKAYRSSFFTDEKTYRETAFMDDTPLEKKTKGSKISTNEKKKVSTNEKKTPTPKMPTNEKKKRKGNK